MLIRELMLRALRKRRPWRVEGQSMHPDFRDGDLVLIDPGRTPVVGAAVIARHPFRNLEVIKYLARLDADGHGDLRSPGGHDSRQFGRVPLSSIRGVVTINVTAHRTRRSQ